MNGSNTAATAGGGSAFGGVGGRIEEEEEAAHASPTIGPVSSRRGRLLGLSLIPFFSVKI